MSDGASPNEMTAAPKCGAHCGLDGCVACELHGLCHMCVEEDWARKFDLLNKQVAKQHRTISFFISVIKSGEPWSEACEKQLEASRSELSD